MWYRHQVSKAVQEASASPGDDWDRIEGPETVLEPPPGLNVSPEATPAPAARKVSARKKAKP